LLLVLRSIGEGWSIAEMVGHELRGSSSCCGGLLARDATINVGSGGATHEDGLVLPQVAQPKHTIMVREGQEPGVAGKIERGQARVGSGKLSDDGGGAEVNNLYIS
jgi:hypothetical protein